MTHKIIKTDNYLIIVDDTEIEKDNFYIDDCKLLRKSITSDKDYWNNRKNYKKIIAHLPLNNSPVLEGIDLLPELRVDRDAEHLLDYLTELFKGIPFPEEKIFYFLKGYNRAKEKYKYEEEDLYRMFMMGWGLRERYGSADRTGYEDRYPSNWGSMDYEERQEWFYQQELNPPPKYPTHFECGEEVSSDSIYVNHIVYRRKTLTDRDGRTRWVGKWIY